MQNVVSYILSEGYHKQKFRYFFLSRNVVKMQLTLLYIVVVFLKNNVYIHDFIW